MSSRITAVIDQKILRIINLFIEKQETLLQLQTISKEAKVPLGTTHRLLKTIQKTGLIETITIGKTKLYKTNKKVAEEFKNIR